jgi:hypothetical protein
MMKAVLVLTTPDHQSLDGDSCALEQYQQWVSIMLESFAALTQLDLEQKGT